MSIKAGLFAVAACASLCFATAANADAQFFFDGLGLNATVTTGSTLDAASGYDILSVTGTVAGHGDIVGLVLNPDQPDLYTIGVGGGTNFTFDNVLYRNGQYLDDFGMVFLLSDGNYADLWGNGPGDYELFIGNYVSDTRGAMDIEVPEPSALPMLLSALLAAFGLGAAGLAKKRTTRTV